jgi:TRAP-type mannitol/chloroaromatic compound transport system permease large subunit
MFDNTARRHQHRRFMMLIISVLGFFIEWIGSSYIALPLFLPI